MEGDNCSAHELEGVSVMAQGAITSFGDIDENETATMVLC